MSQLNIFLFGVPRVEVDHVSVSLGRRKAIALLAYLAVHHQPVARDTVATLLWPEYEQTNARSSLRKSLNMLRAAFGADKLQADRETINLRFDDNLWIDVQQFQQTIAECSTHGHPDDVICPRCFSTFPNAV